MAKTGFWLRGAKGKLAGTTIYRGKGGATIQREINTQPSNPRSQAQMTQRASFADVAKFYRHAVQNLFKFAFESKKATESDYNSFMRLNVGKAVVINKQQQDNQNFPAIGDNWQLSQGSLPECGIIRHVSEGPSGMLGTQYALSVPSIKPVDTTIGQLSTALIADYGLQLNDIVTICNVTTTVVSLDSVPTEAPKWEVIQFRINPDDETPMLDYKLGVSRGASGEVAWNIDAQGLSLISLYAEGFSVIFSRVQQGQPLKVSDAYLHNSATAGRMIADAKLGFYRSSALTSWGAAEPAILQGSLSGEVTPTPPTPPTPPVVGGDINVSSLVLGGVDPVSSNITTVINLSTVKAGDTITVSVDGEEKELAYSGKVGTLVMFGPDQERVGIDDQGYFSAAMTCTLVSLFVGNTIHGFVGAPSIEVSNLIVSEGAGVTSNIEVVVSSDINDYIGSKLTILNGDETTVLEFREDAPGRVTWGPMYNDVHANLSNGNISVANGRTYTLVSLAVGDVTYAFKTA